MSTSADTGWWHTIAAQAAERMALRPKGGGRTDSPSTHIGPAAVPPSPSTHIGPNITFHTHRSRRGPAIGPAAASGSYAREGYNNKPEKHTGSHLRRSMVGAIHLCTQRRRGFRVAHSNGGGAGSDTSMKEGSSPRPKGGNGSDSPLGSHANSY